MRTRFIADLNPRYPSRGEHRWTVFRCESNSTAVNATVERRSFRARKSAERHACRLQVAETFLTLGILVADEKASPN